MSDLSRRYSDPVIEQIPRLLTQVNRNRFSKNYGSCCRDHWHYRILDISNSQKQELVLTLALAYNHPFEGNPYYRMPLLLEWIEAVIRFWTGIQHRNGGFDEVYRNHDSYAATAFTSYMVSETLIELGNGLSARVRATAEAALGRAVEWLAASAETFAMNQNAGAMAAAHNTYLLTGKRRFLEIAEAKTDFLLSRQTREGWFPEYGGADIGYGSLTLAFLASVWSRTRSGRLLECMSRLTAFLKYFLHRDGTTGGLYGSRNTEYFIPLGVELLYDALPDARNIGNYLLHHLGGKGRNVVTRGLDDRYFSYLSPYYLLAAKHCARRETLDFELPLNCDHRVYFEQARLFSLKNRNYRIVAGLGKGGCFRVDAHDTAGVDSGVWAVTESNALLTSQQLDDDWEVRLTPSQIDVRGNLFRVQEIVVNPFRMILVKTFNLLMPSSLRRRFLDWLRKKAVSKPKSAVLFRRRILLTDEIVVVDAVPAGHGLKRLYALESKELSFFFASTSFFQEADADTLDSRRRRGVVIPPRGDDGGYALQRTFSFPRRSDGGEPAGGPGRSARAPVPETDN